MAEKGQVDEDILRQKYTAKIRGVITPEVAQSWEMIEPSQTRQFLLDEKMLLDPRVLYRIVGSSGQIDAFSKDAITGGRELLPDEQVTMKGVPHFTRGQPDLNYASRIKDWGGNPRILAIRESDVTPVFFNPNTRNQIDSWDPSRPFKGRFIGGNKGNLATLTNVAGDVIRGNKDVGGRSFFPKGSLLPIEQSALLPEMKANALEKFILGATYNTERVPTIDPELFKLWLLKKGINPEDAVRHGTIYNQWGELTQQVDSDFNLKQNPNTLLYRYLAPHAQEIPLEGRPFVVFGIPWTGSRRNNTLQFERYGVDVSRKTGKPWTVDVEKNNVDESGRQYIPTGQVDEERVDAAKKQAEKMGLTPEEFEKAHRAKEAGARDKIKQKLRSYFNLNEIIENSRVGTANFGRLLGISADVRDIANMAGVTPMKNVDSQGRFYTNDEVTEIEGQKYTNESLDSLLVEAKRRQRMAEIDYDSRKESILLDAKLQKQIKDNPELMLNLEATLFK